MESRLLGDMSSSLKDASMPYLKKNTLEDIKFPSISSQREGLIRPYQYDLILK